jgi:hypothetical protein
MKYAPNPHPSEPRPLTLWDDFDEAAHRNGRRGSFCPVIEEVAADLYAAYLLVAFDGAKARDLCDVLLKQAQGGSSIFDTGWSGAHPPGSTRAGYVCGFLGCNDLDCSSPRDFAQQKQTTEERLRYAGALLSELTRSFNEGAGGCFHPFGQRFCVDSPHCCNAALHLHLPGVMNLHTADEALYGHLEATCAGQQEALPPALSAEELQRGEVPPEMVAELEAELRAQERPLLCVPHPGAPCAGSLAAAASVLAVLAL